MLQSKENMNAQSKMVVGQQVTNDVDFTSAIGEFFRKGTVFTIVLVGSVNARVQAPNGSLVWLANHRSFFTGNGW